MLPLWMFSLEGGPRRVNHSSVIIGDRIYAFGGYCSGEESLYSSQASIDIFVFNTVSFRWRKLHLERDQLKQAPYMRYGHSSVALGDKAYLFGGRNDSRGACKTLYYFDTRKREWVIPATNGLSPGARDGHAMCVGKGNIYICGGYEAESDQFSEDTFMFDTKTMFWQLLLTKNQTAMWRDFHTLTVSGDKLFLFGGRGDAFGPFSSNEELYDNSVKMLDLNTLEWSSPAKPNQVLPLGRRSHTAFFREGCLYVFGGYNSNLDKHFNDLWKFDPESGLWTEIMSSGEKPCTRRRHCCCYQDNKMYIFGGTSYRNSNEKEKMFSCSPPCSPENHTTLFDLSDTHVLDFEPTLKSLCLNATIKYKLDASELPHDLLSVYRSMTVDNCVSNRPSNKG